MERGDLQTERAPCGSHGGLQVGGAEQTTCKEPGRGDLQTERAPCGSHGGLQFGGAEQTTCKERGRGDPQTERAPCGSHGVQGRGRGSKQHVKSYEGVLANMQCVCVCFFFFCVSMFV